MRVSRPISSLRYPATCRSCRARFSTHADAPPTSPAPANPSARWLSETKRRVEKCIAVGIDGRQTKRAGDVLKALDEEWRELVAGREGFLTDSTRAGFLRRRVVWGEMDSMGHVNNVIYNRWAESARVEWVTNYAMHHDPENGKRWSELMSSRSDGLILRSIRTDYKFPMTWPDHISVFHKLKELPRESDSNFELDVIILSELHRRPAARCEEDIVVYDYRAGKKRSIMPFMMNQFENTWKAQEETRQRVEKRIVELEETVRELENETWERADSAEDVGAGSAKG
ncbi:hypothetical protein OIDMADRAFT_164253 [Oidiodendron maius Zn]|uniref:Thioesterase domain-containing protein n=1 Tax=Oidiodendron maius (strain Zn) TaxID=913774 RepID=A0A0C3HA70_OIDMZ|nr:hypothetical protein OIDMADRAFT_164253 [Oidiodendron maius Zn]